MLKMKLLYKKRDNNNMIISLLTEESDDLWYVYNLISINDEIEAFTSRKVHKDIGNNSYVTEIKKLVLILSITKIDFDSESNSLRVSGKNVKNNDYVKIGQYHTFDIGINEKIKIIKKNWDIIYNEKLEECTNIKMYSEVGILLIDCGCANMYLLTDSLYKSIFSINKIIHKKKEKNNNSLYKKSLENFFSAVLNNLYVNLNFEKIKCIVLGGPGFFKNDFFDFIYKKSEQKDNKEMLGIKHKFLIVKTSSIYKNSLNEILNDENMKKEILNMKAISHVNILNKFYKLFDKNEEKVCYGPKEVDYASNMNAIDSLLITDKTLRNCDLNRRKRYVQLLQNVKNTGGKVFIFSDNHTSGEQLNSLTGVAAILKFPIFYENSLKEYPNDRENNQLNQKLLIYDVNDNIKKETNFFS
ncbi:PelOta protein homologue, putative [Plasmodium relictum]|uniref:Protein pelota homolog n=1 Tax=Plasmodium relictum TaxID=85471 RepID=A0A1J1HC49_PLARL|nr:PelOta protein homologue, putative [Plasmodium relictum]CRH02987.1 PelOta protein homologue, putative [Plasmodium relictum]